MTIEPRQVDDYVEVNTLPAGASNIATISPPLTATRRGWAHNLLRPAALWECLVVAIVTFCYFLSRGLARGTAAISFAHAREILSLESTLHFSDEASIQRYGLEHHALVYGANYYYLGAHLPVLIGVAIWLYATRPSNYRWYRNAFLLSAAIGLTIYVLYPVAPPRFMPGFVDTLHRYTFNLDGSTVGPFYNPYAAMPSLHFGWSLLAGVAIAAAVRSRWLRAAALAMPALMALSVIVTGNHYILDILAGGAVVLLALAVVRARQLWELRAALAPALRQAGFTE